MDLLVCGLGNPGARYAGTRHNVGFLVTSRLASNVGTRLRKRLLKPYRYTYVPRDGSRLIVVEPLTFMNRSGEILPGLMRRFGIPSTRLVIVCDTLDLPPGTCRLKRNGSSAGHRGLASVIDRIGTREFLRFYIGVGRPATQEEVVDFVLSAPSPQEAELIDPCVDRTVEAIGRLAVESDESVLNWYNSAGHE